MADSAKSASHSFDLSNKVAVVTGSSKGIGRAIAETMALHGANVVISSRHIGACESVAEGIRMRGGAAIAMACNVGHQEDLRALVATTIAKWGRIDILVCNAASNPYYGPLLDIDEQAMDKVFTSNIKSVIWLTSLVLPQMAERKDGSVILISSVGGLIGSNVLGFYNMSKAAEQSLAKSLACEWGSRNIRVNCIAPGLIKTDFSRALWGDARLRAGIEARTALRRIGAPSEIAGIAVMLSSASGAFITGQTIVVDGGQLIGG